MGARGGGRGWGGLGEGSKGIILIQIGQFDFFFKYRTESVGPNICLLFLFIHIIIHCLQYVKLVIRYVVFNCIIMCRNEY